MNRTIAIILGVFFVAGCLIVRDAVLEAGRYQVSASASQAILIDTQTGRTWQKYMPQSGGPTYWSDITHKWEPVGD